MAQASKLEGINLQGAQGHDWKRHHEIRSARPLQ